MKIDFDPTCDDYVLKQEKRLSKTQFVEDFTPPRQEDTIIMGTYSRTWRNIPYREVRKGKTAEVNGVIDTPTAHTRDYIAFCYPRRPCKRDQRDLLKRKRMPLYAYPCIVKDAVYLDIKSAWFSIVNLVGWDCEYYPSRWLGRGSAPLDFPLASNKVARSAMVTMGRTTPLPVWKQGHMVYTKMYNTTENYHIWGVIADVLNAIAVHAIKEGARYVNTDGFIISRKKALHLLSYIEAFGLQVRVKAEGDSCICGPGAYVVGPHYSMRSMPFTAIDNVDRLIDDEWLRVRVARFAH